MIAKVILLVVFFGTMIATVFIAANILLTFKVCIGKVGMCRPLADCFCLWDFLFFAVVFVGYAGQLLEYGVASTWVWHWKCINWQHFAWVVLGRRTRIMSNTFLLQLCLIFLESALQARH